MASILVLHPGSMGAALAACLVTNSHEVLWASQGRSETTADRASAAGLVPVADLATGVARADAIISICPPDEALNVARDVCAVLSPRTDCDGTDSGDAPLYVDANAVAPITMTALDQLTDAAGMDCVDGGVIGPPPRQSGRTRLALSGERSGEVATWFAGTNTEPIDLGREIGSASAMKMLYAAWSKQTAALLLQIAAAAEAYGVSDALIAEWERSQPDLAARLDRSAAHGAPKAWRWKGEMEEIAATFAQCGLPAGFSLAAAEVFRRLEVYKDADPVPSLSEITHRLTQS